MSALFDYVVVDCFRRAEQQCYLSLHSYRLYPCIVQCRVRVINVNLFDYGQFLIKLVHSPAGIKVRHGTAKHGTARHGTARHGTARHVTARHGTAEYDASANPHGFIRRILLCCIFYVRKRIKAVLCALRGAIVPSCLPTIAAGFYPSNNLFC